MRLTVTREDIDKSLSLRTNSTPDRQLSTYDSQRDCPIGCALQRTFKVSRSVVTVRPNYAAVKHETWVPSQTANDAMKRWDLRMQFDPHTFMLYAWEAFSFYSEKGIKYV